jgi:capsular exopolysaccharide synthesis family protein
MDFLDDTLFTPDQFASLTHIPLLAVIPFAGAKKVNFTRFSKFPSLPAVKENTSQSWLLNAPKAEISEAFRSFRTSILLSRANNPPKRMLFTSALAGEGKSTLCFNTAVSFALQGKRVLIIDADMRRPRLHTLADCSNTVGLSGCLTSNLAAAEAIQPYRYLDNLHLLPSGITPPMPSELLGARRFAEVLDEVSKDYDFIAIDSPPVLLVTDAQIIASHVDGTLMIVHAAKTTKQTLRRVLARVAQTNTPILGFIMNAVDFRSAQYGYEYGRNSYYAELPE